jgi:hypothetical protein
MEWVRRHQTLMQKHTELDILLNYLSAHQPYFNGVTAYVGHGQNSSNYSPTPQDSLKPLQTGHKCILISFA